MIAVQVLGMMLFTVLVTVVAALVITGVADEVESWKARRRARIEADLDRTQEELRQTILQIADGLASDRDETSRQMMQAAFLETGQTPDPPK